MIKILVVEDDNSLNRSLCLFLNKNGYSVLGCRSAESAYDALFDGHYDMIISDIMMPEIDGFEFVAEIRNIDSEIPIIFVTARDDFDAKQKGFMLGADDFLTKPINFDELLLRIKSILRRVGISQSKALSVGNLSMNSQSRTVFLGQDEIKLTAREFDILFKMLSYPNKTFTRSALMNEFWDADTNSTERTVDVYMTKLREKFFSCADFEIVTVRGLGYKAVIK